MLTVLVIHINILITTIDMMFVVVVGSSCAVVIVIIIVITCVGMIGIETTQLNVNLIVWIVVSQTETVTQQKP